MILIVDDRDENIYSLKRTLELNGFSVDSANSGEDALKKILKQEYTLIILDVQMPGMDGFEVAEAISGYSKAKDIPIIFLSAVNTDKKFIAKGYTSGGVDYVTKPIDPEIFILKVKTLNKLYEQNRELNRVRLYLLEEVEVRKQAEKELNKMMQEQRSVLESLPQIAFTMKPDGEVEYANEQWYLYSDNIKQMPPFHTDEAGIAHELGNSLKKRKTFMAEVRLRNKATDAYRYHLLKIIPVLQGSLLVKWVGTFTDIQEQKTANEILEMKVSERTGELVNKNKALEISNYELQQFASVASHDLKEPLRKIRVFSSILKDQLTDETPEALRNVDKIMNASQRMYELINDLLDYSRLSADTLFEKTNIEKLIAEIVVDLEFSVHAKNAVINIGNIPELEVIPGQIRQVFQNLLSNALKFSRNDVPPIIDISANLIHDKDTVYCRITVADNGIGFDEKYVGKIFTIFQRLNPKEAYEGTGIGLAIVKKIIEKHSGSITARSTEGVGTTFILMLPIQQTGIYQQILTDLQ